MEIVSCFVTSWNILSFRFSDEMAIFPNRGIWLEKMQPHNFQWEIFEYKIRSLL